MMGLIPKLLLIFTSYSFFLWGTHAPSSEGDLSAKKFYDEFCAKSTEELLRDLSPALKEMTGAQRNALINYFHKNFIIPELITKNRGSDYYRDYETRLIKSATIFCLASAMLDQTKPGHQQDLKKAKEIIFSAANPHRVLDPFYKILFWEGLSVLSAYLAYTWGLQYDELQAILASLSVYVCANLTGILFTEGTPRDVLEYIKAYLGGFTVKDADKIKSYVMQNLQLD